MGAHEHWKARGERSRDKTRGCESQDTSHSYVPTPLSYPSSYRSCHVPSEIGKVTLG